MIIVKSRDLELEIQLDKSGKFPELVRVVNSPEFPDSWFAVPKGTTVNHVRQFTRGMEIACWRSGYEALRRQQ